MADITTTEIFSGTPPGNAVAFGRMNNIIAGATIGPTFVSGKATTTPDVADRVLLYDASGIALIAPTITSLFAISSLIDQAAGVASLRTLGTAATQAAQGSTTPVLSADNTFSGTINKFKHIRGTLGGSIVANTGAGTGATAALDTGSSDLAGRFTLTTGSASTTTASIQCTHTFLATFTTAPFLFVVPINAAAIGAQAGPKGLVFAATATGFTATSGSTALSFSTAYIYAWIAIGQGT